MREIISFGIISIRCKVPRLDKIKNSTLFSGRKKKDKGYGALIMGAMAVGGKTIESIKNKNTKLFHTFLKY